ncbi:tight adherence protein B [Comamonas odontotermitis]|uniref:Tight adherence protein B n=1 Tax=Comamonas odontotermitis TaxID=379895 RepID=A0ABR6RI73_9BURK|nr:type II secretion system F family protein [Comamonas odontotermitis]MBB6578866.1 tight adherence protein B [Comamonas odontotermitis]
MTTLAPAILILAALACILLALALWLFARARSGDTRKALQDNLQRNLDIQREMQASPLPMPGSSIDPGVAVGARLQESSVWQRLEDFVGYEAWGIAPRTLLLLGCIGLTLTVLAASHGGLAMGAAVLLVLVLLSCFGIAMRLNRRRAKMLSQLPAFLDNVVRLISIGNSPHASFQLACNNVPEPLGGALQHVSASLNISPDLGQAMGQLERMWGLPEFGLLAAVFRMSTRYGGRADLVLERVSAYIRDRQSAERELHALSTEVRLSAWVLALLPIVVGTLIMVLNEGYFMRMWNDSTGQKLIFVAGGLQVAGSFLLYRLARLK